MHGVLPDALQIAFNDTWIYKSRIKAYTNNVSSSKSELVSISCVDTAILQCWYRALRARLYQSNRLSQTGCLI